MDLRGWRPSVPSRWLLLLAGGMWTGVGVMLCLLAYGWLSLAPHLVAALHGLTGTVLSLGIYRFGFSRLASRNIGRICAMTEEASVFAFQAPQSYPIIVFMMALGFVLRSSPIPKPYLAVLYIGIGGGLFLSSLHYYRRFMLAALSGSVS